MTARKIRKVLCDLESLADIGFVHSGHGVCVHLDLLHQSLLPILLFLPDSMFLMPFSPRYVRCGERGNKMAEVLMDFPQFTFFIVIWRGMLQIKVQECHKPFMETTSKFKGNI